jgi:hypothetical protein
VRQDLDLVRGVERRPASRFDSACSGARLISALGLTLERPLAEAARDDQVQDGGQRRDRDRDDAAPMTVRDMWPPASAS